MLIILPELQGWGENDRGVSYTFGPDSVTEFLSQHDLDLICRAHQVKNLQSLSWCGIAVHAIPWHMASCLKQVVEDGYEFFAKRQLVTIFSAPNYCGEFDNAGAMMSVDETLMCSFQVMIVRICCHVLISSCSQIVFYRLWYSQCSVARAIPISDFIVGLFADFETCRKKTEVHVRPDSDSTEHDSQCGIC